MDAVYPATASALARGRRLRRRERGHLRHRTVPVTFAEIKEVDEESCFEEEVGHGTGAGAGAVAGGEERRRRPDMLDERLGRQFAEFRRRRARGAADSLRELSPQAPAHAPAPARGPPPPRAVSDPDFNAPTSTPAPAPHT